MTVRLRHALFALVLIGMVPVSSNAATITIFDNFGPGDTHSQGGWLVGDPFTQAELFVPTETARLEQIDLALTLTHGPNALEVWIGFHPLFPESWAIESFHNVAAVPDPLAYGPPVTVLSTSHPVLEAGKQYWLVVSYADPSTKATWWLNPERTGLFHVELVGDHWYGGPVDQAAFRMIGESVPEPGSASLCGLTILVLAGLAYTRNARRLRP